MTSDGSRIGQAKQAFIDMRNLLCAKNIGLRFLKCTSGQCYCMDVSHGQLWPFYKEVGLLS